MLRFWMGIYYYAVDTGQKKYFDAPGSFANKFPGCVHPKNPFPGMVVMENARGGHFEICDDCSNDVPPESGYEDVTEEVYKRYCALWRDEKILVRLGKWIKNRLLVFLGV
jgi:hypothetical protein